MKDITKIDFCCSCDRHAGWKNFHAFLSSSFFLSSVFLFNFKKFFQEYHQSLRGSNSLDPDQARRSVWPDLGPNCLPRLSADDTQLIARV